jgi:NADPH-dependent 2,4-dienoyl-CoA reductase/sulfur reductase-like enzyme/rhodanese-related sulfurtransferase
MSRRFHLDIRTNSEAVHIDPKTKKVRIKELTSGHSYDVSYDVLVLSPGAAPFLPDIPGINSDMVFSLRNIPDTYKIYDYINAKAPRTAVVVGGGFIGLEMVENLVRRGLKVHLIELADHLLCNMDYDMAAIIHAHLKEKGVHIHLKESIAHLAEEKGRLSAQLTSGKELGCDMVIMSIGVRPETALAKDAGLKIGRTGGIWVNRRMQTSIPDIYAVGDAVETTDFISNSPCLIPLAGPANKQGRIAANNIHGILEEYEGTQGTAVLKIFDLTAACCGNNERALRTRNIEYIKSFIHPDSHAGYYPGGKPMCIKLLFNKEGRILGASAVGQDGVDKRIDVLSTAIRADMSVFDLQTLELCYAPPFSSAKDPVNMAGYTAANILANRVDIFHWDDVPSIDTDKSFLVDVRTKAEFEKSTIPGAINIPLDDIRERLHEFPTDKIIYIFCRAGLRGYVASRILTLNGYKNNRNLSGGYLTYDYCQKG